MFLIPLEPPETTKRKDSESTLNGERGDHQHQQTSKRPYKWYPSRHPETPSVIHSSQPAHLSASTAKLSLRNNTYINPMTVPANNASNPATTPYITGTAHMPLIFPHPNAVLPLVFLPMPPFNLSFLLPHHTITMA